MLRISRYRKDALIRQVIFICQAQFSPKIQRQLSLARLLKKSTLEPLLPSNSAVYVLYTVLKWVMVLATKTEIAAIFVNYQACIPFRNTLEYLGHPQPDDDYVVGIIIDTVK